MEEKRLNIVDNELVAQLNALPIDYWDFQEEDTKELTHGLHTYPAVMVYPISRNIISLIKRYQEVGTFLDPFAGSGTGLVEAKLAGFKAIYGTDLNPLAVLLGKVKTTILKEIELDKALDELRNRIEEEYTFNNILLETVDTYIENNNIDITANKGWGDNAYNILNEFFKINNKTIPIPDFTNMGYWFKPRIIIELQLLKNSIHSIKDVDNRDFFLVAFSETARYVSNTRNGEFKLFRNKPEKIIKFSPNVKEEFYRILERNVSKIRDFDRRCTVPSEVSISFEDARVLNTVPDNSIDLMVTSPPYGDSRTTVAYGQFSRPALWWLDLDYMEYSALSQVDSNLLGGKKAAKKFEFELSSDTLRESIEIIKERDFERARDVYSFYKDLDMTLEAVTRKMKLNSYQFWVVGNRIVKEEKLLTDRILVELGEKYGLVEVFDIPRNIPNKVMPHRNSPTNEVGKTISTMTNEHIVVLRKDRG